MKRKTIYTALTLLAGMLSSELAAALDFPSRPIRLVVPYAAGGGNDQLARVLAPKLSELLRQPVVIDNRPGAGGHTGVESVVGGPADGYTVVLGANYIAMLPVFERQPGYRLDDLVSLGKVAYQPAIAVVGGKSPITSLKNFVDQARSRPAGKEMTYGTPGVGSPHHLMVERFAKSVGIRLTHVPYRGSAPVVTDLISGNIDFAINSETTAAEMATAGRVLPLAVFATTRLPRLPNVPTTSESGYPGMVSNFWYAIFVPKKVPQDVTAVLNKAVAETINSPEVQALMRQRGFVPGVPSSVSAATAEVAQEYVEWRRFAESWGRISSE